MSAKSIRMKAWVRSMADRDKVSPEAIYNRMRRGLMPRPITVGKERGTVWVILARTEEGAEMCRKLDREWRKEFP